MVSHIYIHAVIFYIFLFTYIHAVIIIIHYYGYIHELIWAVGRPYAMAEYSLRSKEVLGSPTR